MDEAEATKFSLKVREDDRMKHSRELEKKGSEIAELQRSLKQATSGFEAFKDSQKKEGQLQKDFCEATSALISRLKNSQPPHRMWTQ